MTTFILTNESTRVQKHEALILAMACETQIKEASHRHGRIASQVRFVESEMVKKESPELVVFSIVDKVVGAAFSRVTEQGQLVIHVPVDGTEKVLVGEDSLAVRLSRCVLSTFADPAGNHWVGPEAVPFEIAGLVTGFYNLVVDLGGGNPTLVSVANYVLPSFFNRYGKAPFDHCKKLQEPFQGESSLEGYRLSIRD